MNKIVACRATNFPLSPRYAPTKSVGSGNVLDMHLLKTRHNFPGLNPDVIPLDVKLPAPVRA
jgi:hypothetical protein